MSLEEGEERKKRTVLDLSMKLFHFLQPPGVLADKELLVDGRLLPGPRPQLGLVLAGRTPHGTALPPNDAGLGQPPRLLPPRPRRRQPGLELGVLPLEVRHGALAHGAHASPALGLAPRREHGRLVLVLEPAHQGPDGGHAGAVGLLVGKGGHDAELHAGGVEADAVGVRVVRGDAPLDEDLGGPNVLHEEGVGRVPPLDARDQLLDAPNGAPLLLVEGRQLGLDRLVETEKREVGGGGVAGEETDEAVDDEGPADDEAGANGKVHGVDYVHRHGPGEAGNNGDHGPDEVEEVSHSGVGEMEGGVEEGDEG